MWKSDGRKGWKKFKYQITRNLYIMLMRLESPESEGKIFNNFKHVINIIRI